MKAALIKLVSVITVLSIALSACKPRNESTPTPEIQAGTTPTATQPEPAAEPTPTLAPEELPMGFTDLLDQKIASGAWTREEGLVTILKLLAGEISAGDNPLD